MRQHPSSDLPAYNSPISLFQFTGWSPLEAPTKLHSPAVRPPTLGAVKRLDRPPCIGGKHPIPTSFPNTPGLDLDLQEVRPVNFPNAGFGISRNYNSRQVGSWAKPQGRQLDLDMVPTRLEQLGELIITQPLREQFVTPRVWTAQTGLQRPNIAPKSVSVNWNLKGIQDSQS